MSSSSKSSLFSFVHPCFWSGERCLQNQDGTESELIDCYIYTEQDYDYSCVVHLCFDLCVLRHLHMRHRPLTLNFKCAVQVHLRRQYLAVRGSVSSLQEVLGF